jgi:predicted site-specific integrase-resolvase
MTARTAPNFIPPWQDMATLCAHICASPNTVDKWVIEGILPPARRRGGKLMWKWTEVDEYLSSGTGQTPDAQAERIRNASRRAAEEGRAGH